MTAEDKVKQRYPDARISQFGYNKGLVHVITNSIIGDERYLSRPFRTHKMAWMDAASKLPSARRTCQKEAADSFRK